MKSSNNFYSERVVIPPKSTMNDIATKLLIKSIEDKLIKSISKSDINIIKVIGD